MQCDYCHRDVEHLHTLLDGGSEDHICRLCLADVLYCESGGRIPQDPADA